MGSVRKALEDAISANKELMPVDAALVELARTTASAIDDVVADPEATTTEKTKALYLIPHIQSLLKEMLATPAARKAFGLTAADAKPASRLALIKKAANK